MRKKLVIIGLTVTAVLAAAAVAVAQYALPTVKVTASSTPATGGTAKKPKGIATLVQFNVNAESNSTLKSIDFGISKNLKIDTSGFKTCTAASINAKGGDDSGCNKAAQVGTGASTALLGPGKAPLQFTVNVYAAGKNALTLALHQVTSGSGVNIAFPATVSNNHIAFTIPDNVSQPAPGLYSYVTSVTSNLDRKSVTTTKTKTVKKVIKKKGKKRTVKRKVKVKSTHFLVTRVGCSGGIDTTTVTLGLLANPNPPQSATANGSTQTPCK